MRFRVATAGQGGQQMGDGIANLFRSFAMAPMLQAQAADEAKTTQAKRDLLDAQTGLANAGIGRALAEAAVKEQEGRQLAERPDMLKLLAASRAGTSVPEFNAALSERTHGAPVMGPAFLPSPIDGVGPSGRTTNFNDVISNIYAPAMATPADKLNWDQIAKARGQYQDQGILDQAVQAANGGNYMGSSALSAVRGKKEFTPFKAVGTTGTAINEVTGAQPTSNPGLRTLFGEKMGSEIGENKAQANSANASAGASGALTGLRKVQTLNETVKGGIEAADYQAVRDGKPLPSSSKVASQSRGADSTDAKTRNAIVAAVENDMGSASDEVIEAEVQRRLARRGIKAPTNENASVPAAKPKSIDMASAEKVKAQFKAGKITKEQAKAQLKQLGMD